MFGRKHTKPQRPLHTCSCGSQHWIFNTSGSRWLCRVCGSDPCATCVSRKVTGACAHLPARSQADADLATVQRYYLNHPQPSVAVIPFEAWVARVLAGETVADILDKARGTIESDILDEELRRLYDAQRNTPDGGCTDGEWARRMALNDDHALACPHPAGRRAHKWAPAGPHHRRCEGCGKHTLIPGTAICPHGVPIPTNDNGGCAACSVHGVVPASPKRRCDHSWQRVDTPHGPYRRCRLCGVEALPRRSFTLNFPDSPHPQVTLAAAQVLSYDQDPDRKGSYGPAVIVKLRDGTVYHGDDAGVDYVPPLKPAERASEGITILNSKHDGMRSSGHPLDCVTSVTDRTAFGR